MTSTAKKYKNSDVELISVNFETLINRPSIEQLDDSSKRLIKSILRDARSNANSTNKLFNDIKKTISYWELINYTYNKEVNTSYDRYKIIVNKHNNGIYISQRGLNILKKSSVPTSYVVFLCAFLVLAIVSIICFAFGLYFDIWIVNIWVNLFIILGSVGMILTVITAIYEWRKKLSEKMDKQIN